MNSKKGGFGTVVTIIIAFTVVIVLSIIIIGPKGGVAETAGTINEKENALLDMVDNNKQSNRDEINADPLLVETWNQLVSELEYVKQNNIEDYCIIPFERAFFSDRNNIEFLQNDDNLLLKIGYSPDDSQSGANRFKTYPIDNMNLYYGEVICPNGETLEDGVSYCPSLQYGDVPLFGPIKITKVDTLETDAVGLLLNNVHTTDVYNGVEQTPYTFQPLYVFNTGYEASISTPPSTARADVLADGTSGIILANSNNVVFMLVSLDAIEGSGISSPNSAYTDLLINFDKNSGIGGNENGYAFCNPANNKQLAPKSGDLSQCKCDIAQNKAMCESYSKENCGVDCVWDNDACINDPDNIKEFYRSMGDILTQVVADNQKNNSCISYYPLQLTHDIPVLQNEDGTLNEENLGKYIDNMRLAFLSDKVSVYDTTNYNTLLQFSYTQAYDETPTISPRILTFSYNKGRDEINIDDVVIKKQNGQFGFFVQHGKNGFSFLSTDEVNKLYNQKDYDLQFCDPSTPYQLGLISRCSDAKGESTCLYHGAHSGTMCYWNQNQKICVSDSSNFSEIRSLDVSQEVAERINALSQKIDAHECISRDDLSTPLGDSYAFDLFEAPSESYLVLRYVEKVAFRTVFSDYPVFVSSDIKACPDWWEE